LATSKRVWALTVLALLVATAIMMIQRQQTYANLPSTHSDPANIIPRQQVMVTDDLSTFHAPGCKYIQGKHPHAMDAAQAVAYGYTPCVRCDEMDTSTLAQSDRHWKSSTHRMKLLV